MVAEYSDVEQIARLQAEQVQIDKALTILDDYDGTVSTYTIVPTAEVLNAPMGVSIATVDPGQSLIAGVRSSLIQRYNQINQELRGLGVTGTPPDQAGGPPTAETQPA